MTIGNSDIQEFLVINEEGNKIMPTIEQLTNELNN